MSIYLADSSLYGQVIPLPSFMQNMNGIGHLKRPIPQSVIAFEEAFDDGTKVHTHCCIVDQRDADNNFVEVWVEQRPGVHVSVIVGTFADGLAVVKTHLPDHVVLSEQAICGFIQYYMNNGIGSDGNNDPLSNAYRMAAFGLKSIMDC